jgi:hypothetical protein
MNGRSMTSLSIADLIPEITRSIIGVKVNPHLFRAAAMTSAAIHAGDNPNLGNAVLHHQPDSTVAEENYNRATCISASRAHTNVVQRYRRGSGS